MFGNLCNQKNNSSKLPIDIEEVDFIELKRQNNLTSVLLPQKNIIEFVHKWNKARPKGLIKYIPDFWLKIAFKDGRDRNFRIKGKYIKENNDLCYNIRSINYFESLWQSLTI